MLVVGHVENRRMSRGKADVNDDQRATLAILIASVGCSNGPEAHANPGPMRPVLMIEEGGRGGVIDYTRSLVGAMVELGQPVELVTASDHLLPELDGVVTLGWFHYLRPTSAIRRTLRALPASLTLALLHV